MDKIASFNINHNTLEPGIYVSRADFWQGATVTTFDLRLVRPNREEAYGTAELHTVEHIGATFLRNSARRDEIVYFGPMGCRTGFYLIMFGTLTSDNIAPLVTAMFEHIAEFSEDIPGASPKECGNYSDQNLTKAKLLAKKYLLELQNKRYNY